MVLFMDARGNSDVANKQKETALVFIADTSLGGVAYTALIVCRNLFVDARGKSDGYAAKNAGGNNNGSQLAPLLLHKHT